MVKQELEQQRAPRRRRSKMEKEKTETKEKQKTEKNLDQTTTQSSPKEESSSAKEMTGEVSKDKKPKKEEAIARGLNMPISKKHAMYICSFIKGKPIDLAISNLELVKKLKKAVPFKGEIPHRKGMMSGRYPVKASTYFIALLKSLRGNSLTNGLDLEKTRVVTASATWASRPTKRGGMRFKRTNVILIAKEITPQNELKEAKK